MMFESAILNDAIDTVGRHMACVNINNRKEGLPYLNDIEFAEARVIYNQYVIAARREIFDSVFSRVPANIKNCKMFSQFVNSYSKF